MSSDLDDLDRFDEIRHRGDAAIGDGGGNGQVEGGGEMIDRGPEEGARLIDSQRTQVDDALAFHEDGCTLGPQAPAVAGGALGVGDVLAVPFLHALAASFFEAPHHPRDDAFPVHIKAALTAFVLPFDIEFFLGRSVEQDLTFLGRQLSPWRLGVDAKLLHHLPSVARPPTRFF